MALPSGYKRLEYIQSSGTQCVDSGFKPNQNTRIILDAQILSTQTSEGHLASVVDNTSSGPFFTIIYNPNSPNYRSRWGTQGVKQFSTTIDGKSRYIFDRNKETISISDSVITNTAESFQFQASIHLFCRKVGTSGNKDNFAKMVLYSCQIYDNGTLVRDFIPCQKPDGTIGLWDDVNSVFYGNAGTGTFAAGAEVDPYGNDDNTLLLLHGEDLTDSSPKGVAVTNNGVSVSDAQSKFGGKSLYFNGENSYLISDVSVVGDMTIDFWIYPIIKNRYPMIFEFQQLGDFGTLLQGIEYNATYEFGTQNESGSYISNLDISAFQNEAWNHIAIVREGETTKLFINGTLSCSIVNCRTDNDVMVIGNAHNAAKTYSFNGYIDEFRISNIARWTEDFTPPTNPYTSPIPSAPANLLLSSSTDTTATLVWDVVDGATGYKLYRDGSLIATVTDTSYTDTIQPFTSYVYTLTAYNDNGESEPAAISVQIIIPPETPSNFRAVSASMTAIALEWDAVNGADSYQLKRDGAVVYTGTFPSYTDSGLTAETAYTYALSAVNAAGISEEIKLEASTTRLILVTDRTQADVTAQNSKGIYTTIDLIRVGEVVQYLADILAGLGYACPVAPKLDWQETDWPTPSDMERYLQDVSTLRGLLTQQETTPNVPKSMAKLTHWSANDIEQILMDLDDSITRMKASMFYAGEIYSGEESI